MKKSMKKNFLIFSVLYLILLLTPLINLKIQKSIPTLTINYNKSVKNKPTITTTKNISNKNLLSKKEKSQLKELSNIISAAKTTSNPLNIEHTFHSDGYFNILNIQTGNIDHIPEKDYVIGAVCAEMPPNFHPEALKAQAISAHTYALKMREEQKKHPDPSLNGADFSADPTNWKKYVTKEIAEKKFANKFNEYWAAITSATNDVIDIIMLYNNEPIIAAYHAISSGKTESANNIWGGEAPYLLPTESYGDDLAPDYETTLTLTTNEVKKILLDNYPSLHLPPEPSKWFENIKRSNSSSVLSVTIDDTEISGNKIRNLFNLRSLNFNVLYNNPKHTFTFTVKGYGHGVGLSQYGANYMAKNGSSFDEILKHYYSNISFAYVSNIN